MHHISFGNVLKEARLARGLDLATVSRELRIRQDIIVAIENSDFARMPSRGYARNMVIAYARLLGLNEQDISRMYLDQEYAYQVDKAHQSVGDMIQMHTEPYKNTQSPSQTGKFAGVSRGVSGRRSMAGSARAGAGAASVAGSARAGAAGAAGSTRRSHRDRSRFDSQQGYSNEPRQTRTPRQAQAEEQARGRRVSQSNRSSDYDGSSNGFGRRVYSQNLEPAYAPRNNAPVAHRARRSAMNEGRYTNLYSQPKNIPNPNRNRNMIIGIIAGVVIVVALVIALALSHQSTPQTNIPVTGIDNQQNTQSSVSNVEDTKPKETPPSELTLKYDVASGSTSYIEVYVDGKAQQSGDVKGPMDKSFSSTDKIRFVCSEPKGVTVYVNDQQVDLKTNSSGIVNQTFTFKDVLDQWYKDHPDVQRPSDSAAASDNSDSQSSSDSSSDTAKSTGNTKASQ